MKKTLSFTAGLIVLWSAHTWAVATIDLNNYQAKAGPIFNIEKFPWTYASATRTYVQLLAWPGGLVTLVNGSSSVFRLTEDGYFNAGVGIVPGVADGAIASFVLSVWMDTPFRDQANRVVSVRFTQATGSWNPDAIPPLPATGPDLLNPPVYYFTIPEPPAMTLGLMGGAILLCFRGIAAEQRTQVSQAGAPCRSSHPL